MSALQTVLILAAGYVLLAPSPMKGAKRAQRRVAAAAGGGDQSRRRRRRQDDATHDDEIKPEAGTVGSDASPVESLATSHAVGI